MVLFHQKTPAASMLSGPWIASMRCSVSAGSCRPSGMAPVPPHLLFDPSVGRFQSHTQRLSRRPAQLFSDEPVIRIASAYALRSGNVVLSDTLAGYIGHQVYQLIYCHHLLRPDIDRPRKIGAQEAHRPFDALIDIEKGPGLLAIAPHL